MTTVITNAGIAAINLAGSGGPLVNVTTFKIGSGLHQTPVPTETDVFPIPAVYVGPDTGTSIEYQVIDQSNVQYVVTLDETVGNFDVGNVGLYLQDGTLFALAGLPSVVTKYAIGSGPNNAGNRLQFRILINVAGNVDALLNLSLLNVEESALPVVQTEANLPSASSAPFPVYVVNNYTVFSSPVLAIRYNGVWNYTPSLAAVEGIALDAIMTFG